MTTIDTALAAELRTIAAQFGARVIAEGAGFAESHDPYLSFSVQSSDHVRHMTGGAGLVMYRYNVDVYSRTRSTVAAIVDSIRESLDNRIGMIGAPDGVVVASVTLDGETNLYEPDRAGRAGGWHRSNLDIVVWISETETPAF